MVLTLLRSGADKLGLALLSRRISIRSKKDSHDAVSD